MKKSLAKDVRVASKQAIDEIMGISKRAPRTTSPPKRSTKSRTVDIRATYKKNDYFGQLLLDTREVRFNNQVYPSPSAAGRAVTQQKSCNGLKFWKYRDTNGDWTGLYTLNVPARVASLAKSDASKKAHSTNSPLSQLVGKTLKVDHKGTVHVAKVLADGKIQLADREYPSLTKAAKAVTNWTACNAWKFWKYENERGEWVYIDESRKN